MQAAPAAQRTPLEAALERAERILARLEEPKEQVGPERLLALSDLKDVRAACEVIIMHGVFPAALLLNVFGGLTPRTILRHTEEAESIREAVIRFRELPVSLDLAPAFLFSSLEQILEDVDARPKLLPSRANLERFHSVLLNVASHDAMSIIVSQGVLPSAILTHYLVHGRSEGGVQGVGSETSDEYLAVLCEKLTTWQVVNGLLAAMRTQQECSRALASILIPEAGSGGQFLAWVGRLLSRTVALPHGVATVLRSMLSEVSSEANPDAFFRVARLLTAPPQPRRDAQDLREYYGGIGQQVSHILVSEVPKARQEKKGVEEKGSGAEGSCASEDERISRLRTIQACWYVIDVMASRSLTLCRAHFIGPLMHRARELRDATSTGHTPLIAELEPDHNTSSSGEDETRLVINILQSLLAARPPSHALLRALADPWAPRVVSWYVCSVTANAAFSSELRQVASGLLYAYSATQGGAAPVFMRSVADLAKCTDELLHLAVKLLCEDDQLLRRVAPQVFAHCMRGVEQCLTTGERSSERSVVSFSVLAELLESVGATRLLGGSEERLAEFANRMGTLLSLAHRLLLDACSTDEPELVVSSLELAVLVSGLCAVLVAPDNVWSGPSSQTAIRGTGAGAGGGSCGLARARRRVALRPLLGPLNELSSLGARAASMVPSDRRVSAAIARIQDAALEARTFLVSSTNEVPKGRAASSSGFTPSSTPPDSELHTVVDPVGDVLRSATALLASPVPATRGMAVDALRELVEPHTNGGRGQGPLRDPRMHEVLELLFQSLGDPESYVYLMAVRALVAAAGADSATVIPAIAAHFGGAAGSGSGASHRVRAGEALVLALRQCGPAAARFADSLIPMLIHGASLRRERSDTGDAELDSFAWDVLRASSLSTLVEVVGLAPRAALTHRTDLVSLGIGGIRQASGPAHDDGSGLAKAFRRGCAQLLAEFVLGVFGLSDRDAIKLAAGNLLHVFHVCTSLASLDACDGDEVLLGYCQLVIDRMSSERLMPEVLGSLVQAERS